MMFTKETIKDGHKMVDGVFRAISKNKVPNPSKDLPIKYYYSTNKGQKYIPNEFYGNNIRQESNEFILIKKIILMIIVVCIILLALDFFNMYRKVKRDNDIERNQCLEEFKANKCEQINIDDGPHINEFCKEKKKCILDNEVCFHEVLIRYAKNVIFLSIKEYNVVNIILVLITILIIFRIIY